MARRYAAISLATRPAEQRDPDHRTLFTVADDRLVDALIAVAERVVGDFDADHTGLLFTLPVGRAGPGPAVAAGAPRQATRMVQSPWRCAGPALPTPPGHAEHTDTYKGGWHGRRL